MPPRLQRHVQWLVQIFFLKSLGATTGTFVLEKVTRFVPRNRRQFEGSLAENDLEREDKGDSFFLCAFFCGKRSRR